MVHFVWVIKGRQQVLGRHGMQEVVAPGMTRAVGLVPLLLGVTWEEQEKLLLEGCRKPF